jgi:Fe-S-cluster containining protein
MTDEVRSEVLAVYAAADAAVRAAGPRCDASGRCCRFTEYGHTLFISAFEADILLENAPGYERPVSRDGCPFQVRGLCTARDARPLGCRIYFCDPGYQERMAEITETALAALKRIADACDTGWSYAPLHHFLNAPRPARPADAPGDSMTPPATRSPLPVVNHPGG